MCGYLQYQVNISGCIFINTYIRIHILLLVDVPILSDDKDGKQTVREMKNSMCQYAYARIVKWEFNLN